jgi:hypothetical protein
MLCYVRFCDDLIDMLMGAAHVAHIICVHATLTLIQRRLGSKVVGVLLGTMASFPCHVARSCLIAQLAGDATVLPLKYTGLAQTLVSIPYADAFRYAYAPPPTSLLHLSSSLRLCYISCCVRRACG